MAFSLHPQLAADCVEVGKLELCDLLLLNDARFPWCVLVPRIDGAREIHTLPTATQAKLWQEVASVAAALESQYVADKMNVAALGNMVPQLHVHVIARNETDAAWPSPVWGFEEAVPYTDAQLTARLGEIRAMLIDQT